MRHLISVLAVTLLSAAASAADPPANTQPATATTAPTVAPITTPVFPQTVKVDDGAGNSTVITFNADGHIDGDTCLAQRILAGMRGGPSYETAMFAWIIGHEKKCPKVKR